ncbi:hypothetical protein SAMN02787108_02567 [Lysinibacillus fusiformis]|nr:hypothetical protein SAMN02787108_02567 [Lysinibacillus fusiformis]SDB35824.1 hypothetical protein SAMN02787070_02552 [Lysinibacillus fusiformis]SFI43930.1 hypothetical protein SAMN02787080_02690 [Lysinibacillus fusiformis]SFS98006.1 hypothetical protein SAMN02787099_02285 [Lysinibacillus fusiformis]
MSLDFREYTSKEPFYFIVKPIKNMLCLDGRLSVKGLIYDKI